AAMQRWRSQQDQSRYVAACLCTRARDLLSRAAGGAGVPISRARGRMIDRRCCRALPGALALLVLLAAGPAAAGRNVWTPVGPDGTAVWALAVDPAAPLTAYVSTARGTF